MSNITRRNHQLTKSMALNIAAWTEDSAGCYGVRAFQNDSIWWRQPGGPPIYLPALIHNQETTTDTLSRHLQVVQEQWGTMGFGLYDCWATHDLSHLGFELIVQTPWYLRYPSPQVEFDLPDALSIETVATPEQLKEFEYASWIGFGSDEAVIAHCKPFSQHAIETLNNPDMVYLLARLDDEVVAGVITHVAYGVLGIYGISTLPQYRRRGYGTALVRAAVALRPDLPVSVHPDPPSVPMYTQSDFFAAGEIAIWERDQQKA